MLILNTASTGSSITPINFFAFIGANIILISQGHINAISREDEKEIRKLAKKHELRIHTLPLVHDKTNISTLFESISYHTGGNSFFVKSTKSDLELYMDLLDSLREIRARSETNGPALVMNHSSQIRRLCLLK